MFTLFVLTILIFFLHNSQKCITFAPDLEKDKNRQLIAIKPKPINL